MSNRRIKNSGEREKDSSELLAKATEAVRSGEVIVFPTETFYGLGTDASNEAAVVRVASLKGRDPENPIPLIISDLEMLKGMITELPSIAERLMDHFWPGPLTLVLPAQKGFSAFVQNRKGAVGVRISSHPIACALVKALGRPLTATSANPSGKEPARTVGEAQAYFSGKVDIFLDGGRLEGKKGSTVAEVRQDQLEIIREGEISSQELERVVAAARRLG